jgi:UDP-2,3-diacylglucosamine pyrophosphatase LpxH
MSEHVIIISDLHLGSDHLQRDEVEYFFANLPADADLVLNGDIVDVIHHTLPESDQRILDRIIEESRRRKVVWAYGNHDDGLKLEDSGQIEFCREYNFGTRLHINHGYDFDNIMPKNRWFVATFRQLHRLRILLGAEPVHVANYAKRWPFFYRYLRSSVIANAVEHALERGYEAVTCGHTHYPEDVVENGVRYVNTGSWTESPIYYLWLTPTSIDLKQLVMGQPVGGLAVNSHD